MKKEGIITGILAGVLLLGGIEATYIDSHKDEKKKNYEIKEKYFEERAQEYGNNENNQELKNLENLNEWKKALERTTKISQENKKIISDLEKEIFYMALAKQKEETIEEDNERIPPYEKSDLTLHAELLKTAGYYSQITVEIARGIKIKKSIEEIVSNDKEIINFLEEGAYALAEKDIPQIKGKEKDCKVLSSLASAIYLSLKEEGETDLVVGLVFEKKYAPYGEGHQWVVIKDKIIDPALKEIKNREKEYIPIVGVKIKRNKEDYYLSPKVYCLPSKLSN
ncbi:MAG: hypothetical protein QW273_01820 [Candidatus Pacearchaeota archaeon]